MMHHRSTARREFRVERAHAKVNLMLRILAREANGYHGIETLFQKLALHDVVRVQATEATRVLTCDGPSMPHGGLGAPESNLAWRAAEAYVAASGWQTGWDIAIEKHIPVGGGLGGGSADAAAVLRALEAMSPMPIGPTALLEIGGSLGADVAFFVAGASLALGWGRGDRLLALVPLPVLPVSLFTFADGVNTAHAYAAFARAREEGLAGASDAGNKGSHRSVRARAYAIDAFTSWTSVRQLAANDFEPVVSSMHAGVGVLLPSVRRAAAAATSSGIGMLSGSGATCYLLGDVAVRDAVDDAVVRAAGARIIGTTTA
jgi:4-diphosphocytidyl-2-C-methyl-D-erythritol kinase